MRSKFVAASLTAFCSLLFASLVFGQGGNGTITGTVSDPTGLPVAGANVQARNVETGVMYSGASTSAGNYAIADLPVGTYELTVTVSGFKTYTHTSLAVDAAKIVRVDIPLEVGATSESITVEAQASLLQTESGDLTHNVTVEQMDDLPLLGIGTVNAGTSGYRNPYNTLLTLPGVSGYASSGLFTINGLGGTPPGGFIPSLSETMRIEGQDATSQIFGTYVYTQMAQPDTDAVQEIAYQTSNYAAEYGQAGSVVINMTMKSGTNQFHGTGFEYFVNEDLNAANPFTIDANGNKFRPLNRRNDFGGTLGGPVMIPKLYNGKNKTFFFFAYEQFLEGTQYSFVDTVPTVAYRNGDFSAISPNGNCSLCSVLGIPTTSFGLDNLGNPVYANEIYDPSTRGVNAKGGYALPFPGNIIPMSRFSPSSIAFLNLFPLPQNANLINNYDGNIHGGRYSAIPSVKIDQIISSKDKLSFYWDRNNTESQISAPLGNADGLPEEIGGYRGTFIPTWITRLNYDRTISPTLLLHVGAGYFHTSFSDRAPFLSFNPSAFDLSGFIQDRQFPSITGMCVPPFGFPPPPGCGGYGGMQAVGTSGQIQTQNYEEKPSFNANLTWVRGSHTYKVGAEAYLAQIYNGTYSGVTLAALGGPFGTSATATQEPYVPQFSLNGFSQGFGFADFLLGDYSSITQSPNEFTRLGNQQWGLFIQDSWKVSRKLTLNYGLRWDYATPQHEQYGRLSQLSTTLPNGNADGYPGATIYASNCHCPFYQPAYPYAIGPRFGAAYELNNKTVIRGGWGVNYQFVANAAGQVQPTVGSYPLNGINPYVNIATPGAIVTPTWPVTDPNVFPVAPGILGAPNSGFGPPSDPLVPDRNQNRPPRINQWSIGIQRQITANFIVEASYVANRAVWLGNGPLGYLSQTSPQEYASFGLYPYPGSGPCPSGGGVCKSSTYDNFSDYLLTTQPLNSPGVQARLAAAGKPGFTPYPSFNGFNSLQAALYPFPQFGALEPSNSPTGDSKYDSLQIKVTKRFSHGLQASGTYTWGQGFVRPIPQDFFNPQSARWQLQQIPPQTLNFNAIYTVPKAEFLPKAVSWLAKDWQIGWFANYQSGQFLAPPVSPNLSFLPSEDIRVKGQPLYTQGVDINNLSTYNPWTTQVLNPNAWAPCPSNAVCAAAAPGPFGATPTVYYRDFRGPRTPTENANIGRHFRFGPEGKLDIYVRAEFVNIFNRTLMPNPITTNPQNPVQQGGAQGQLTNGFGVIQAYFPTGTYSATPPYLLGRTGTLIARFQF
ncbi:MAG: TonB-dependent receptor [Bryobacterales bacterium]|nr:TonB-dependent receptor [Bryobacterales bacterium]